MQGGRSGPDKQPLHSSPGLNAAAFVGVSKQVISGNELPDVV